MRKLVLCAAVSSLALGCEALLGSFDVSEGAQPDLDADVPETSVDAAPPGDAGDDAADASAPLLECGVVGAPRTVALLPQGTFQAPVHLFRVGNLVRVVVRQPESSTLSVYSFDPNAAGGNLLHVEVQSADAAGPLLDVRRTSAGLVAMTMETFAANGYSELTAWTIPDTVPTLVRRRLSPPIGGGATNTPSPSGQILPLGGSELAYVLSRPVAQISNQSEMYLGRSPEPEVTPDPVVFHSGPTGPSTRAAHAVVSRSGLYVFDELGPEPGSPEGTSYWTLPVSASIPGPVAPKPVAPRTAKPHVAIAVGGQATGGIRAAFAEIDLTPGAGSPGTLRIGAIPDAQLGALDASTVPVAFALTSVADVPSARGGARFLGDDFLWVGSPPEPLRGQGLNFYWYDMSARQLRARNAGATRLLSDRRAIEGAAAIFAAAPSARAAAFDLVWIETPGDGGAELAHATVECVR